MESLISKNYLSLEAARKSGTEGKPGGFSFSFTCILSQSNTEESSVFHYSKCTDRQ